MKPFLAEIAVRVGESEFTLHRRIDAESAAQAEKEVLERMCHSELDKGAEWADSGIYDQFGEHHYSVHRLHELRANHALILDAYLGGKDYLISKDNDNAPSP